MKMTLPLPVDCHLLWWGPGVAVSARLPAAAVAAELAVVAAFAVVAVAFAVSVAEYDQAG